MPAKKNLLILYADQLRLDSLGCYDNPVARTPNIDSVAAAGARLRNHYAVNPMCMPSRAAFFTGRYPQANRLLDNGIPLPPREVTLPALLAQAGYVTHGIGKIHLTPFAAPPETHFPESFAVWRTGELDSWNGPYVGFDNVELVLNHGETAFKRGGHYGRWVVENFPDIEKHLGPDHAPDPKCPELQCFRSNLPVEAHHSAWIARRAEAFLREIGDRPFCLFASFPDPHHPFTPPSTYARLFEDAPVPGPFRLTGENDSKPLHYRRAMTERQHPLDGGAHKPPALTDDVLRLIQRNTYGQIALIDDCVGRILGALRDSGLADNTVVLFSCDHGELFGDHWLLFKGPYPCRSLLNIPLVISGPGISPGVSDAITSNVDVLPTLLDLLGLPVPSTVQGASFASHLTRREPAPRAFALVSQWCKDGPEFYHHTLYSADWRLSIFYNQPDGELYDLAADPHEHTNLFHVPAHRRTRDRLLTDLLTAAACAEPPDVPADCPW